MKDLALDNDGDLALKDHAIYLISGAPLTAQRISIRLQWFLGEWFLDLRQGIPYFRDILIKNPDRPLVDYIFTKVLLSVPGVLRVASLNTNLDRGFRHFTLAGEVVTVGNDVIVLDGKPFIIE